MPMGNGPHRTFCKGDKWAAEPLLRIIVPGNSGSGTSGNFPALTAEGKVTEEEAKMPVLLLWAVPTVIVVGGVGYYFLRAVH